MNIRNQNAASGLRAVSLLILFLSGWLAAPVKFVLPEPSTCEMECCLVKGYHHCQMGSASFFKRGDDHHHSGEEVSAGGQPVQRSKISLNAVSASCSSQCSLPPSGLQNVSVQKAGIYGCSITVDAAQLIYVRTPHFARDALAEESHAPRAPPTAPL